MVDSNERIRIGDYFADANDDLIWKVTGIEAHSVRDPKIRPVRYLGNKKLKLSIRIEATEDGIELVKGQTYLLKRPPLSIGNVPDVG